MTDDDYREVEVLLAEEWLVTVLWLLGAAMLVSWPCVGVYATIGFGLMVACKLVPKVLEGM